MQFDSELLQKCRFLAGPTACGKSTVAVVLAERVGAEILALDSMSLYQGMDIGTAKPAADRQNGIPHHLVDIISPHEEFSVAEYVVSAENACRDIVGRGRMPLFVGGTGLYLRAVLRGVFNGPAADEDFRRKLEAQASQNDPGFLHRRLTAVDPQTANRLHPHDSRRLVRALEVFHATGRPLSEQQTEKPLPPESRPRHVNWLSPPRSWLYEQINRRVESMIAAGLVDEVRSLLQAEQPLSRTARQALGYKEIIDHLDGRCTLDEAVDLIQRRTRQFAKRQHTWFRNLEECTAVAITGEETAEQIADRLLDELPS